MGSERRFLIQRNTPQDLAARQAAYRGAPYTPATRQYVPGTLSWELAERAYAEYHKRYREQSMERMAERGGFSHAELLMFGLTDAEIDADFIPARGWVKAEPTPEPQL